MNKRQFLLNFFAVMILVVLAFVLTRFANPIRSTIQKSQQMVAGANTENIPLDVVLPKELSKDAVSHVEKIKENVLQVQLGEIIEFVSRTGKITQDIRALPGVIEETIQNITDK